MLSRRKKRYDNSPLNLNTIAALFVSCLLLSACGGSSSNSASIPPESLKNIAPQSTTQVITLDEQEFTLITIDTSESLSVQGYWPSGSDIPVGFLETLNNMLPQLHNIFADSYFAFAQVTENAEDFLAKPLSKSLVFSPLNQNNNLGITDHQIRYNLVDASTIQVYFLAENLPQTNDIIQSLIANIYQSERMKYQPSNNDLSLSLSQGLALHFVEQQLSPNALFVNKLFTSDDEKRNTLALVKTAMEENETLSSDLFSQELSWQVGYFMAGQHFKSYPGSDAANSFSLPLALFTPWLDPERLLVQKQDTYVRTSHYELTRQAIKFPGGYFLEGGNNEKLISLTFDDGPSAYTVQILDVLNRYDVPASFFWQGTNLKDYQELVKQAISAGHTVANHSWDHTNGMIYSPAELWQQQVVNTNAEFQTLFGITPRFYRPPYGEITDDQVSFLLDKGMKLLLWSIDSKDWDPSINSVSYIESQLINHQHEEVISLMHDAGGDRQNTVDALSAIIEHYHGQGYRFVNVETLLGISDKY